MSPSGLVGFGHVALDGTKIKANASKNKAMSYARAGKRSRYRLRKQIVEPVFGQIKQGRSFRQFLLCAASTK
jgi:hypothetical protein